MAATAAHSASDSLLIRVTRADNAFDGALGLLLLLATESLARFLGVNAPVFGVEPLAALRVFGLALLVYSAAIFWTTTKHSALMRSGARLTAVLNTVWVPLSLLVVAEKWLPLTSEGQVVVIAQAVIIGIFATLQWYALGR